MDGNLQRRHTMQRLHIYPEEDVPPEVMENVTNQIKQLRPIPQRIEDIPEEEIQQFPKLIHYPADYVMQ